MNQWNFDPRFLLGLMSGCVWRYTESTFQVGWKRKKKRLSSSFSRFHLRLRRAFFPVFNSSPARFELRVVGRPSRFASSRPAKKVKGSGQRVGGRCRTAWLIHLRYSLIEESCKAFRASVPTIFFWRKWKLTSNRSFFLLAWDWMLIMKSKHIY